MCRNILCGRFHSQLCLVRWGATVWALQESYAGFCADAVLPGGAACSAHLKPLGGVGPQHDAAPPCRQEQVILL
jgi:hypothetical protein